MSTIETDDGTRIFLKDLGTGLPIVLVHGWPLDADAWDAQVRFLARQGYRVIAPDRRGHGRSTHAATRAGMDTYADDLAAVIDALGLREATLVGQGAGGGDIARYIGRHGTRRISKAILIGATPPLPPWGADSTQLDGIRTRLAQDRRQFFRDLALPFYGYDRPGATPDAAVVDAFCAMAMRANRGAQDAGLAALAGADTTADLKKFNVPTLFIHGGVDRIVPLPASAAVASRLVKNSTLKVYSGAPHGLWTTLADQVNADIVSFLAD